MPSNEFKRAVRAYMDKHGVSYTAAHRAVSNQLPNRPGIPPVPITVAPSDDHGGWGVIQRSEDGWLITPANGARFHEVGRTELVPVEYMDPHKGPSVIELPPVVRRVDARTLKLDEPVPTGPWAWAATGWSVDQPGEIADQPATPAPSLELPYEIRCFSLSKKGLYLRDYVGSEPQWYTLAWCATPDDAAEIARRCLDYTSSNKHGRVRVWGPSPDDPAVREVVFTVDPPATPGPRLPRPKYGQLPAIRRPEAPAPTPEPAWTESAVKPHRRPRYDLRVWSPDDGWRTIAWSSNRQYTAIVAGLLCIGVHGQPWPYAEAWGPGRDEDEGQRVIMDYYPDETHQERTNRYRLRDGAIGRVPAPPTGTKDFGSVETTPDPGPDEETPNPHPRPDVLLHAGTSNCWRAWNGAGVAMLPVDQADDGEWLYSASPIHIAGERFNNDGLMQVIRGAETVSVWLKGLGGAPVGSTHVTGQECRVCHDRYEYDAPDTLPLLEHRAHQIRAAYERLAGITMGEGITVVCEQQHDVLVAALALTDRAPESRLVGFEWRSNDGWNAVVKHIENEASGPVTDTLRGPSLLSLADGPNVFVAYTLLGADTWTPARVAEEIERTIRYYSDGNRTPDPHEVDDIDDIVEPDPDRERTHAVVLRDTTTGCWRGWTDVPVYDATVNPVIDGELFAGLHNEARLSLTVGDPALDLLHELEVPVGSVHGSEPPMCLVCHQDDNYDTPATLGRLQHRAHQVRAATERLLDIGMGEGITVHCHREGDVMVASLELTQTAPRTRLLGYEWRSDRGWLAVFEGERWPVDTTPIAAHAEWRPSEVARAMEASIRAHS